MHKTLVWPGVQGVWAVRFWPEGLDWEPAFSNHAFLLMGLWAGTKVLCCLHCVSMFRSPPMSQNRALVAFNLLPFPSCNTLAAYVHGPLIWETAKWSALPGYTPLIFQSWSSCSHLDEPFLGPRPLRTPAASPWRCKPRLVVPCFR